MDGVPFIFSIMVLAREFIRYIFRPLILAVRYCLNLCIGQMALKVCLSMAFELFWAFTEDSGGYEAFVAVV